MINIKDEGSFMDDKMKKIFIGVFDEVWMAR